MELVVRISRWRFLPLAWLLFLAATAGAASDSACYVCGKIFKSEGIFTSTDQVTGEKIFFCRDCAKTPACYICGAPMGPKGTSLPDGRHLCPRDAKGVVLDPREIVNASSRAKDDADHDFIRFMTFPDNISTVIIDRLDVQSMFVLDGHDVECPDILGWCRAVTNGPKRGYLIGLMSGLPPAQLQATCVHELGHTWIHHNLPVDRQAELMPSTKEGFCELLAYLVMKKRGEEQQIKVIQKNLYTRGQANLFIEAERRYGLNDILDWMKSGDTTNLVAGQLQEIRNLKTETVKAAPVITPVAVTVDDGTNNPVASARPERNSIRLDGVLWMQKPAAIINGRTFQTNESGNILLGKDKIPVRCLAIEKNSARILRTDTNEEMLLQMTD